MHTSSEIRGRKFFIENTYVRIILSFDDLESFESGEPSSFFFLMKEKSAIGVEIMIYIF